MSDDIDFVQAQFLIFQENLEKNLAHKKQIRDIEIQKKIFNGVCISCGGKIAWKRVLALPETKICIKCAENSEID